MAHFSSSIFDVGTATHSIKRIITEFCELIERVNYFPTNSQRFFIPYSVLVFITCFVIQFAFYFQFDSMAAAQYSAFAQNVTMSILLVNMLVTRKSAKGQSTLMAVAK